MKKYTSELTAFTYIITFTLGLVGYLQTNEFDFISSCYNSLRLFILEFDGSVDNIPFLLNLSRFLSPLILASSIFLALKEYFNIALLNFKIRHLSGHTIVFCNNESDINFIHKKPNTLLVTNIFFDGLSLVSENINDIEKVNIEKAEKVILLNDDRTNLSYLREIKKRFPNLKNITLYIKLEDNENVRMFNRFKLNTNFKKELLINPRQLFSREVFLNNPVVDYVNYNKVPHALVSGKYENIKWLIFEMANISHYPSLKNLQVTLIGNESENQKEMLIDEFPNIDNVIDFSTIVKSSTSISKEDLSLLDITAVYISEKTLEEGQITASHLKRIFYFNKTNSINTCVINFGFGLIDDVYETAAFNSEFNIKYFDYKILRDLNIIQHLDDYDIISKKIHNDYYEKNPDHTVKWEDLPETMKMSNRYQAYHTNIKLGYLGYNVDVNSKADKISITYSESQLGLLAQMEKRRWNAERLLSGWIYGEERSNKLRIHPLLVPWEKLDEKQKQKDRDTVANITNTITTLGFSITKVDE